MQKKFAAQLAKYRKRKGMTQEILARQLNVTPQAVSKWEKGGYPDGELLPEISRILDVSLDVLFGLREDEPISPVTLLTNALQELPEAQRSDFCIDVFYAMLSAYGDIRASEFKIPDKLLRETYGQLKTDRELALMRLNPDMRFFCFFEIPEDGFASYAKIYDHVLHFYGLLSRREALQMIYFFAGVERNHLWSADQVAAHLHYPTGLTEEILAELVTHGIVWKVKVNTDEGERYVYGYTHSTPLSAILVLTTSFFSFLLNNDPIIETWKKGPFRTEEK